MKVDSTCFDQAINLRPTLRKKDFGAWSYDLVSVGDVQSKVELVSELNEAFVAHVTFRSKQALTGLTRHCSLGLS